MVGELRRPDWAVTAAFRLRGWQAREVRRVHGVAQSVRVMGKGNQERWVPLPAACGQGFEGSSQ